MTVAHAPSLLVVDDDEDHRFLVTAALADAGYRVTDVGSGAAALAALDGHDLALVDYWLPDMTGLEILAAAVESGGPSVVMLTAMGSEALAVDAMRAGALDYLVKDAALFGRLPHAVERALRAHDLSRRARLLQRMSLLVTSSLDRDDVAREIVSGARRLLRADACGLVTRDDGVAVHDGDVPDAVAAEARALLSNRVADVPADAHHLFVPLPAGPDGDRLGVLAVLTDEPRYYGAEELQLAESFAAFAGIALANANRLALERDLVTELQQTLDLRRAMVMSLSHELRTPLTCILGFAETISGHWESVPESTRRNAMGTVLHHARDLQSVVEDLLDFAALETGRMTLGLGPLAVDEEVRSAVAALAPLLGDRPVEVTTKPVFGVGDPTLLRRAVANLLSNAAKHSAPGAPIRVEVGSADGACRVSVTDAGAGLTADEQHHVFEPFWRGREAVTAARRGSGIGLALVHEYVRVMGGEVAVESAPGRGSRFSFTLPLAAVPQDVGTA